MELDCIHMIGVNKFMMMIIITTMAIMMIMIILIGLQLGGTLGSSPTHSLSGQPSTLANAFCIHLKPMMMIIMLTMIMMMTMMTLIMIIMMTMMTLIMIIGSFLEKDLGTPHNQYPLQMLAVKVQYLRVLSIFKLYESRMTFVQCSTKAG